MKKRTKKTPPVRVQRMVSPLVIELFKAGLAARRKYDGYNDGLTWNDCSTSQQSGFIGIGKYVADHFKRANESSSATGANKLWLQHAETQTKTNDPPVRLQRLVRWNGRIEA